MSSYRYTLSDYHAIKEADIVINGITVLAGENGCGKSTLSRWLYYLINGFNRFDEFVYDEFLDEIKLNLHKPDRVRRDIQNLDDERGNIPYGRILGYKEESYDLVGLFNKSRDIVDTFQKDLVRYMKSDEQRNKNRILMYLSIPLDDIDNWKFYVDEYCDKLRMNIEKAYLKAKEDLMIHPIVSLKKYIGESLAEEENSHIPASIQLYENQTPLLTERDFSTTYLLRRAIYIDTPMSLAVYMPDLNHWEELREFMITPEGGDIPLQGKTILTRIGRSIAGKVSVDRDALQDEELHYHRADGLNIKLEYTATGIKSFAYLQRLLENGYLNEETLLLIDEPEAHLHPQWIVEFARLLVLLHKQVGLKIMIASHNPDMVSAIQSIARKEGVLDNTCFYQAEKASEDSMQYIYKNLGSDISEIFKSFNIAISRIQDYGATSLSE